MARIDVAFFDPPVVLDCSVTPVPGSGSSVLQVVAHLPFPVSELVIMDAVGRFVGIYSGSVGNEILVGLIGTGTTYSLKVYLKEGDRISVRNTDTDTVTRGACSIKFIRQRGI